MCIRDSVPRVSQFCPPRRCFTSVAFPSFTVEQIPVVLPRHPPANRRDTPRPSGAKAMWISCEQVTCVFPTRRRKPEVIPLATIIVFDFSSTADEFLQFFGQLHLAAMHAPEQLFARRGQMKSTAAAVFLTKHPAHISPLQQGSNHL